MKKLLFTAAAIAAATGIANAQPLPAPPTAAYVPNAEALCQVEPVNLYFPVGETDLTPSATLVLSAVQARLDGCVIGHVSLNAVVADADTPSAAEAISHNRLEAVAQALAALDLASAETTVESQNVAATRQAPMPVNRAVELRVTAWAPEIS